ncbi:hypothetical protein AURDEDRAFT_152800 [Auricularia subglabra TFB-10046 SS5]|nr:hypothetical protein AURDEDRAFT_152800 [Auricularia subglabra TFB-10046 SS5]
MSARKPPRALRAEGHPLFNFGDSDITLISSDGVSFHVHKARLSAVSLMFKEMFDTAIGTSNDPKDTPQLDEPADTLAVLLAMCYPFEPDEAPFDLVALVPSQLMACYEASEKYRMWVAQQYMLNLLMPLVQKDPFRLVRTAYVLRKQNLLTAAARATLEHDILEKTQYREDAGNTWVALLEYHIAYKRAVIAALQAIPPKNTIYMEDMSINSRPHKYCSLTPAGGTPCPCKEMETDSWRKWQMHQDVLCARKNAQWPRGDLLSFANERLDWMTSYSRKCGRCSTTWKEVRERATRLEPELILTLEQIDRTLQ